jgi:hypothetical protein
MPRNNKNTKYTSNDFKNDLQELQQMIGNYQSGGFSPIDGSSSEDMSSNYSSLMENPSVPAIQAGGKKDGPKRHFKLVSLNGKEVDFEATAEVSIGKSPSGAARKMLKSIAHHKNLFGNNKAKLGVVSFVIRETTRGSKTKEYGPYKGEFKKYSAAELKKSSFKLPSGKTLTLTMKPVIHLNSKTVSKKNNVQKGGK